MDVFELLPVTFRRARLGAFAILAALALAAPGCETPLAPPEVIGTTSQAETPDSFGVGTGRDGAFAATSAGQVVNSFAAITALDATATQVTIGSVKGAIAGFVPGNLVLVWRTTGLAGVVSGTQTAVSLTADVGAYEFGRVKSVAGSVIVLTNPLGSSRYANDSQIVRVPEYTTVSIPTGTSLVPYAWDGTAGGIIAFLATGAVTAVGTGAIIADGAGFRGGGLENSSGPGGATALDGWVGATPGGGAHKGEGFVPSAYAVANAASPGTEAASTYGRGNYANGAGGGDAYNAGGGGGGNGGAGGIGGRTWNGDGGGRVAGGLPGSALTYSTTSYLALGGGGGAGEENNNDGSAGGNGGGVILVRAASLTVAGTLSANGESAADDANSPGDGLGGGGAGGDIVLDINGGLTCVVASAVGGDGGAGAVDPDGPGGGGGGGVVVMVATPGACPSTVSGGLNGTTPSGTPSSWGAASGAAGVATATFGAGFGGATCATSVLADTHCGGCVTSADCPAGASLCDTAKNTCGTCLTSNLAACSGTTPACDTDPSNDVCAACTGDNGTATTLPCPGSGAPYCAAAGSCGKCAHDSDCTQGHAGPFCNATSGACGNVCFTDAECGAGNWCNDLAGAGACQPETPNGTAVPGGSCGTNDAVGARACASQVCDSNGDSGDACGYANGDGPCATDAQCRSDLCGAGTCLASNASDGGSGDASIPDAAVGDGASADASNDAGSVDASNDAGSVDASKDAAEDAAQDASSGEGGVVTTGSDGGVATTGSDGASSPPSGDGSAASASPDNDTLAGGGLS